ncbi:hypothetical protein ACLH2W_08705 [Enterobacter hormaechei]|uniref:hypothetical protein n=1 Tax=Enterobacter hormaechei TaxID=158836 RepID=UPI0035C56157
MDLDDERVSMIVHAMGRAVMDLSLSDQSVTQEAIIEKLEHYRRETGNVISKGVKRDAAEVVREGSQAVK